MNPERIDYQLRGVGRQATGYHPVLYFLGGELDGLLGGERVQGIVAAGL